MIITRKVEFSASHVCRNPGLSDEENARVFGLAAPILERYRHFTEVFFNEEKAIALARNSTERRRLRAFLAGPGRSSKLFDTARTTAALAYLMMADQYCRRVREPFRVQPAP